MATLEPKDCQSSSFTLGAWALAGAVRTQPWKPTEVRGLHLLVSESRVATVPQDPYSPSPALGPVWGGL